MKERNVLSEALQVALPDAATKGIQLLTSIEDVELLKSIFICLIYRMDPDELKALVDNGASAEEVFRRRNDYLVTLASDQDPVIRKAEAALAKTYRLEQEQEDIKKYLKNELAQALEMSKKSAERERDALLTQVTLLREQLKDERDQKEELKLMHQENAARIAEYEEQISTLKNTIRSQEKSSGNSAISAQRQDFKPSRRKRFPLSKSARLREVEEFQAELTSKPDLSRQQKDFLISALEAGYSFDSVCSPSLLICAVYFPLFRVFSK